jgi:hypothetical protein
MQKLSSKILTIFQIIFGYFVALNYLAFFDLNNDPELSLLFYLHHSFAFAAGFTSGVLHYIFYGIYLSILYVPGILYLIITYKKAIPQKRFILHVLFVVFSYLALITAPIYAEAQKRSREQTNNNEVEQISLIADEVFDVNFQSTKMIQSTSQIGEVAITVSEKAKDFPKGKYLLVVSPNNTSSNILSEVIEITEDIPYIKLESNNTNVNSVGYGQGVLSKNGDSLLVRFIYDNSGPATNLDSIAISLVYKEPGVLNDKTFYTKTVTLVNKPF